MSIHYATRVAHESKFKRARVGAVIVRGSRILSSGYNHIGYSRYFRNRRFPESIHAEQQAIIQLLKRRRLDILVGSDMFVSRVGSFGESRLARPCQMCQQAIEAVGIRRVYYTTETGVEQLR